VTEWYFRPVEQIGDELDRVRNRSHANPHKTVSIDLGGLDTIHERSMDPALYGDKEPHRKAQAQVMAGVLNEDKEGNPVQPKRTLEEAFELLEYLGLSHPADCSCCPQRPKQADQDTSEGGTGQAA
jgi:hypothetical protein